MNSKSDRSTLSNKKVPHTNGYQPVDGCNHLTATSLRDLISEYKRLDLENSDPSHLDKETPAKPTQKTKSDSAHP